MDDMYFKRIKRDIGTKLKIQVDQYKDSYILRRISVRMRLCKCKDFKEYYEFLLTNPAEFQKLENTLTVNVTEFWRDRTVYNELKKLFESIVMDKKNRSLKIWSAGCSSGEEPYGLAIIIKDLMEKHNQKYMRVTITATDLDKEILEKAKNGQYISKQLKNMDDITINKYFTKLTSEEYEVKTDVKRIVQFKKHDLINEGPISGMNIVLCRNVIIYFDKQIQEELFMKFHNALIPDGYLVLGKTEMLHGNARNAFKPVNHRERIYQKLDLGKLNADGLKN
ncbi:Protein-glutamate O-methyltransferase [Methanococcus vannielii SB]|uniref:protein-glutamate O-methyltransferase n=1 Tax=Methanococcus vannielii (strain ATCC 35089 / DSM 1224 / JCM 13029 / OCM 148 / SB) TaxID=406327 RepID=A6UNU6_METVS|nr:protein-glutamate O-methyltransferase CheR [Methanococcus vannielii]ABR54168.1 Protein-glutamate O-methyltransferase [Methanococcus vannielii SB]